MKNNQILKIYGTEYKEMTKQLLARADLIGRIPSKDCRIGIKPNLVAPSPAEYGATTHPEIVAGIIEYLQEHGCRNLVIAEGSWVGDKTAESIEVCGYDRLAEQYGVELHDAQKDKAFARDCAGLELSLCECVRNIDFLINVPVLKGHCQTKLTCALKNMKGLLPNKEKRHFHAMGLHKPIAHLSIGVHQDFVVVDHICGDLDFEDGGNPVVRNCIMAACDPVLVDAYACGLLHYKIEEIPYICMAEQLNVGTADLSQAEVGVLWYEKTAENNTENDAKNDAENNTENDAKNDARNNTENGARDDAENGLEKPLNWLRGEAIWDEELPYADKVVAVQDLVEEVESCSACYGYLLPALDKLRAEGLLDGLNEKICIGQGYRGKKGRLGVGACTTDFDFCVKGCPPTEIQIYEELRNYILSEKK